MSSKADISVHAIFLIIVIGIFIFAIFVIFYSWINIQNLQASKELCATKLLNYCTEWWKNGFKQPPYDWNNQAPAGCEKAPININQPTDSSDCKSLLGIK